MRVENKYKQPYFKRTKRLHTIITKLLNIKISNNTHTNIYTHTHTLFTLLTKWYKKF